ncbi:hypothetical protein PpBr36_01443, partial [Pyricularia pennisetigena]|uniref:hypothetical protein n=1 Tax=Pyricularia pennisetigena TaxID=1578925 RepID=UPI001154027A
KKAIVLVHGAWYISGRLDNLAEPLRKDFLVDAPELETSGPADVVRNKGFLNQRCHRAQDDAGHEIVVVAHSAGGITAAEAVAGNPVQERRDKGLDGGVKAVIFIASLIVFPGGISLDDQAGGVPSKSWYEKMIRNIFDGALVLNPGADKIFYNDVDEVKATEAMEKIECQSTKLFTHKVEHGSLSIQASMTYIFCGKDVAVSPALLDMFADGLGDKYTKVYLDCSHTPWMQDDVLPHLINVVVGAAMAYAYIRVRVDNIVMVVAVYRLDKERYLI